MKKKILLFITPCILAALASFAQSKLAARAGINISTARARYNGVTKDNNFVAGPHIGLQFDTEFEGRLHFSPFIAYNHRGYVINKVNDSISEIRNSIHYIDLAPLISYHFSKTNLDKSFYLTAGPVMGIAIGGKEKTTTYGQTVSKNMQFSLTGKYGYFDLSMLGGIGWRSPKWYLEANYLFGLGNINNEVRKDKRNIQNRSIGIHAGFYFKTYKASSYSHTRKPGDR